MRINFKNKRSWHTDFSVYGSLFIEKSSFDNIIFCDTDMLIFCNLDSVFSLIDKYDLVAVKANSINSYFNPKLSVTLDKFVTPSGRSHIEKHIGTKVNWDYITFNSGFWGIKKDYFMYMKQKYWQLMTLYESEFTFHDQTFINLVCCLENKLYYDLGFGYNAVNVGTTNIYTGLKSFVKYLVYKITRQNYRIHSNQQVSYKGNKVSVLHYTGCNKPFIKNRKLYGDGVSLWNTFKTTNF